MTGFLNLVSQARPGVIVKLDLPSAQAGNHAPAVIERKFFNLLGRHRFQSRELGRMSDETFWLDREDAHDFIFDRDKVWVHR
jgi:hypothetical protein